MKQILKLKNLTCCRGPLYLIKGLDLKIEPGHVLRLSGPNGCGKSTLLKTIAGRISPAQGEILYGDSLLTSDAIHFLDHKPLLKTNLTVNENIEFWAHVYNAQNSNIEPALQAMGLIPLCLSHVNTLSQGQLKRAQLSLLLVRKASIWLLDEPLNSLDFQYIARLGEAIRHHIQKGGIVIYASHTPIPGLPETVVDLQDYQPREEEIYETSNSA